MWIVLIEPGGGEKAHQTLKSNPKPAVFITCKEQTAVPLKGKSR